jgi:hypothetical protein
MIQTIQKVHLYLKVKWQFYLFVKQKESNCVSEFKKKIHKRLLANLSTHEDLPCFVGRNRQTNRHED